MEPGFSDISAERTYGLLKKPIRPGSGIKSPTEGCRVRLQIVARLDNKRGPVVFTSRDVVDGKLAGGADEPMEFVVGWGETTRGLDAAVQTMVVGEVSEFIASPSYAYGEIGDGFKIPPDATVWYELELISFGSPMPRLPPPQTAEERHLEQLESAKRYAQGAPLADERMRLGTECKEKGNAAMKDGDFAGAKKHYDSGFVNLCVSKDEVEVGQITEAELEPIAMLRGTLHLNRALANIKLNRLEEAMWDCNEGLKMYPTDVKGLFRRATVLEKQVLEQLKKEERKEFWDPDRVKKMIEDAVGDVTTALAQASAATASPSGSAPSNDAALTALLERLNKLELRRSVLEARKEKQLRVALSGKFLGPVVPGDAATAAGSSASCSDAASTVPAANSGAGDSGCCYDDMPPLED